MDLVECSTILIQFLKFVMYVPRPLLAECSVFRHKTELGFSCPSREPEGALGVVGWPRNSGQGHMYR
jgi:hypothetical protein